MNITCFCNLIGLKEFRNVLRQLLPEILKVLSHDACVAGIAKISHAILEIKGNLLIIDCLVQNLNTFQIA